MSYKELQFRAALFRNIRSFFEKECFIEIDTPIRLPVLIPESNITPVLSEDLYLQTSPEMCMKRLLANGADRIFQLCKCFRKEERGRLHLEEFTLLEWYRCGADYTQLMRDCQDLFLFLHEALAVKMVEMSAENLFSKNMSNFSLSPPWPKTTVAEAFARWSPVSLENALLDESFDEILVEYIEPKLGCESPIFLCDYPASMGSLAKKKREGNNLAERFELYIQGIEIANGFSELTDPDEQRLRFEKEIADIVQSGRKAEIPEDFLKELGNIEQAAGIALGVDRLAMIFLGKSHIEQIQPVSLHDFKN